MNFIKFYVQKVNLNKTFLKHKNKKLFHKFGIINLSYNFSLLKKCVIKNK